MRGCACIIAPRWRAALLAAAGAGVLLGATSSAAAPAGAAQLRERASSLEARERAATLELYALQSQLARANARLAGVRTEREAAETELARLRIQLDAAWQSLFVAEERLGARIRQLYQNGEPDPAAILLGAESLDQAIERFEGLRNIATSDKEIVSEVRQARIELGAARRSVAARAALLQDAERALAETLVRLEAARAERQAYVARLSSERGFTNRRIARLELVVRTAREKTEQLASPTAEATPVAEPVEEGSEGDEAGGRRLTVLATAYAIHGRTATGIRTARGVVAVDPSVIPLGTRLTIPGYGAGVAADTGGAIKGNVIDVWFPTVAEALAWGRRTVTITIHDG